MASAAVSRSHAIIVCSSVPTDCIPQCDFSKRERTFLKDSRRLVLLRRSCSRVPDNHSSSNSSSNSSSSKTHRGVLLRKEDQDNPEPPSMWKQMRSAESLVEKGEPELKVDLRIEGIAQDVILKYEERMEKIQRSGLQITDWIPFQINH